MEPQGQSLAAAGMGEAVSPQEDQQAQMKELVMKVVQLLMSGKTPEELLKMGVPKEVIDMAIQLIQQQQQASQQTPQPSGEPSLAASGM